MKKILSQIQLNMVWAAMLVVGTTTASAISITETFDTSPGSWFGSGNTSSGHNFGFSATDNTLGTSSAGEAGGEFAGSTAISFYGTSLGGNFSLADTFHADGEFAITGIEPNLNNNILIGFFNSSDGGDAQRTNILGLSLNEPGAPGYIRAKANFNFSNGGLPLESSASATRHLTNFTSGRFSYDYNPLASGGNGAISFSVFDNTGAQIGTTSTLALSVANRARGVNVDSFGILTGAVAGAPADPTASITVWMDNLNVSAVAVPEPGTFALLGMGAAMALGGRWMTRRARK
jgi:hypothetical protein